MKFGRFGILSLVILIVSAISLAVLGPRMFAKKGAPSQQIHPQAPRSGVTSKGVVESEKELNLSSQIQGLITEIAVKEGDLVNAGQLLVRMEDNKINARIKMAEASLSEAEALLRERVTGSRSEDIASAQSVVKRAQIIYDQNKIEEDRQVRLFEANAVTRVEMERAAEKTGVALAHLQEAQAQLAKLRQGSRQESIEQAKANVEKSQAELNFFRSQLTDYALISPFDGLVIQKMMEPGETVDIGSHLLTIIDPQRLRIRAEVEETDVGLISEGQTSEVITDAFPNRIFHGKVYKVFPNVNKKAQRTFDPMASFDINTQKIYIELEDYAGLVHGMTLTVRFVQ